VRLVVEPQAGKNRALNRGRETTSGALVVFTDDDVTVGSGWLRELAAGAARWPEASIFGGRILPRWPDDHTAPPAHPFFGHAFGIADFANGEKP
jgi:GT2 family glycosyltransferase